MSPLCVFFFPYSFCTSKKNMAVGDNLKVNPPCPYGTSPLINEGARLLHSVFLAFGNGQLVTAVVFGVIPVAFDPVVV